MLRLDTITKSYAGFDLGPLSLDVEDEVVAILGPSGCGKTTLLAVIAGLTRPDTGTLELNGTHLNHLPIEQRGTVLLFQEAALFPHLTARANIEYAATTNDRTNAIAETLDIIGILDQPAETLSGGERQRVALARALAADPAALLLDEPLANLDAPIKRRLKTDLRDLLGPLRIPVIYVTHDQTEAASIGDRIAVMNDGQFCQIGPPTAVFEHPISPFVAEFTGAVNVYRGRLQTSSTGAILHWGEYRFEVNSGRIPEDTDLWFSIRPEFINLVFDTQRTSSNIVEGHITDCIFDGDAYRLSVVPDSADDTIEITVLPPRYKLLQSRDEERVTLEIPPETIHLIGTSNPLEESPVNGYQPV